MKNETKGTFGAEFLADTQVCRTLGSGPSKVGNSFAIVMDEPFGGADYTIRGGN